MALEKLIDINCLVITVLQVAYTMVFRLAVAKAPLTVLQASVTALHLQAVLSAINIVT